MVPLARNPPKEVTWLVEVTVPKDPVPPTERLPDTVRAPVSVSPAVVSDVVVMLVKLPVPPVNVPAIDRLLTKVLPLPFTKKGELVPL